jgi:hypothetical protein
MTNTFAKRGIPDDDLHTWSPFALPQDDPEGHVSVHGPASTGGVLPSGVGVPVPESSPAPGGVGGLVVDPSGSGEFPGCVVSVEVGLDDEHAPDPTTSASATKTETAEVARVR